jgi:hypothetical protein
MTLPQNSGAEPAESLVLAELHRVLGQALDEVASEQRLDLAYEVIETVRFEHSHISWLDRLRNTSTDIQLHLAHTQLPVMTAQLVNLADPFMVLRNHSHQFLVNANYVTAASGLSQLAKVITSSDRLNWLDNIWFHDLADRRQLVTWFLVGDQTVEGFCLRTGFDAIDIETNTKVLTLPKQSVVAGRMLELGSR